MNSIPYRIGFGYDVHQLKDGRPLFLGGVELAHDRGLDGHSDADVLIHAICDAMLGALALRDIGHHFPPSDASLKNIDSKILLSKTYELIKTKGYKVGNIDSTICAEEPKINPYICEMTKTLSSILEISPDQVSIKATTTERLGFVGRREGMDAYAVVLLYKE